VAPTINYVVDPTKIAKNEVSGDSLTGHTRLLLIEENLNLGDCHNSVKMDIFKGIKEEVAVVAANSAELDSI